MNQFGTILSFELKSYFKNKIFAGITAFLVVAIAAVMFFPNIKETFFAGDGSSEEGGEQTKEIEGMLLLSTGALESSEELRQAFAAAFANYEVCLTEEGTDAIKEKVASGEAAGAIVLHDATSYTYYADNLSMYDSNTEIADEILAGAYRRNVMLQAGMTPEAAEAALLVQIEHETESLGKDQAQNFFYTYIMIFALYMVILLYGQMVATNVATEKSSRAMELLITSAKPVSMMFGKVLASCLAGLIQLLLVFGSSILFYQVNQEYWADNWLIASVFAMPVGLFGYMLLFFVLGFLIYAFLFGAIGSMASKVEDINTSVMPLTILFVAGFIVVMTSMSSGELDSLMMRVCSYVPFTSPMAMFARIAMSTVPLYEIAASIVILIASVVAVGILSAKIYRVGVLLYGAPPKFGAIFKALKKA